MLYVMGDCFRCDRSALRVTYFGELEGGVAKTPVYACRACVERLTVMHAGVHADPARPYVAALTP